MQQHTDSSQSKYWALEARQRLLVYEPKEEQKLTSNTRNEQSQGS